MFTGIVEGVGKLQKIQKISAGLRFVIQPQFRPGRVKIGESVAVNGVCLTCVSVGASRRVAQKRGRSTGTPLHFDVARESLKITNLGKLKEDSLVNLELALRLGDRLGGHLVSGHIDGVGKILKIQKFPNGAEWTIRCPSSLIRYFTKKGSVTVDGVNLTVNKVHRGRAPTFSIFLIPHTLRQTNFYKHQRGDEVNLEVDNIAKYLENFVRKM
ncbi:MAG: riboflavin synthase [bacterium]|nr:riboflavin synthase [bacterium]